jgi:hypothetical protein
MGGEHFQNEGLVLITFALCFMMGKAPSQNALLNVIIVKYQWVFTNVPQFCFFFFFASLYNQLGRLCIFNFWTTQGINMILFLFKKRVASYQFHHQSNAFDYEFT